MNKKLDYYEFYEKVPPIKITEARRLKLKSKGWGLLTDYYLESVKINNLKGTVTSVATLRICDRSGQVTCVVKGPSVGLLFGLTDQEWKEVEELCGTKQQLFYRFFKDGISTNFGYEQKLFYNFCASSQTHNVLAAIFVRCVNNRNNFKSDALLEIITLNTCDNVLMDLYNHKLRNND